MKSLLAVRLRHARHYANEAANIQHQYLLGGDHVRDGLARFDLERGQIDTAWMWILSTDHDLKNDELRIAFATASNGIAALRYRLGTELVPRLEAGVEAAQRTGDQQNEALLYRSLGVSLRQIGHAAAAVQKHEQELAIWRELGSSQNETIALVHLGYAYLDLGQISKAQELVEQALQALSKEIGGTPSQHNPTATRAAFRFRAYIANQRGDTALDRGQFAEALEYYEEQLAASRVYDMGSEEEINALGNVGTALVALHRPYGASQFFQLALDLARTLGFQHREGKALFGLALCALRRRDLQQAIELLQQALHIADASQDRREKYTILARLGEAYTELDDIQRALGYYRAVYQGAAENNDLKTEAQCALAIGRLYERQGDLSWAAEYIGQAVAYMREEKVPASAYWANYLERIRQRRAVAVYPPKSSMVIRCPYCKRLQDMGGPLKFNCSFCGQPIYTIRQALIALVPFFIILAILPLPVGPRVAIGLVLAAFLLLPRLFRREVIFSVVSSIEHALDYMNHKTGWNQARRSRIVRNCFARSEHIMSPLYERFYVLGAGPSSIQELLLRQYRQQLEAVINLLSYARRTLLSSPSITNFDRQQAAFALYKVGVAHRLMLNISAAISCFHQACIEMERLPAQEDEAHSRTRDLGLWYLHLGDALQQTGNMEAAARSYRCAVDLLDQTTETRRFLLAK